MYRVTFLPAIHADVEFNKEAKSLVDAEMLLDAIADYTLLLHDASLMSDFSNTGYIEQFIGDDWELVDLD